MGSPNQPQRLLVELDDGDWLEISITSPDLPPDDDSPYLDLANGIIREEDGVIVAATPLKPPSAEA